MTTKRTSMADWWALCQTQLTYLEITANARQQELDLCAPHEFDRKQMLAAIVQDKRQEARAYQDMLSFFDLIELDRPQHEKLIKARIRQQEADGHGPPSKTDAQPSSPASSTSS